MNKSQTKEYRRNASRKWRKEHGAVTLSELRLTCRRCGKEFMPKNARAQCCNTICATAWAKAHRVYLQGEARIATNLRNYHHLTLTAFDELLLRQNKLCAMCRESFGHTKALSPCIDHDHNCCPVGHSCNHCRRGIIHTRCNLIIGHAKDRMQLLAQGISYLQRSKHEALSEM